MQGTVADDDYGLSIARGAFKFAAGDWTVVAQRVRLNALGQSDGASSHFLPISMLRLTRDSGELELWVERSTG